MFGQHRRAACLRVKTFKIVTFLPCSRQSINQVLIVGGGMGGLVLAATLSRLNIPYKLFERREVEKNEDYGVDLAVWPAATRVCVLSWSVPHLSYDFVTFIIKSFGIIAWIDVPTSFSGVWPINYTILLLYIVVEFLVVAHWSVNFQILQELGVASGLWPQVDQIQLKLLCAAAT